MANDAKILLTAEDRTRAAFASVERSFAGLQGAAVSISNSLAALGGVAGVGALGLLAKNAIGAMAALDDFAEATGTTVEAADKLYQIARISGVELGTLQGIVLQLNKALFLSDEKDSAAAKALDAIGLSADDLRRKSPDEALRVIAGRLREFEDGASKSAVTLAVFGKRAGEVAPLLNDIASAGEVAARVTAEQAAQAEKLTKEWNALAVQAESVGIAIANRIVPAFNTLIDTVERYRQKSGGIGKGLANLAEDVIDPQSVLSLEKQIADKARELARARDEGDAARERTLTGEIVQLNERLRLQKALVAETKKANDEAAKIGSRGKIDASGIKAKEPASPRSRGRDPEADAIENRMRLAREADAESEDIARNNKRRFEDTLDRLLDEDKAREQANAELQKTIQRYEDMADPLAVYRRELGEIDRLEAQGALNAETASKARAAVSNDLQEAAERLNGTLREQDDIGRQLGMTFASAFEDAIIKGESLRDVLKGMAQDIARLYIRKSITEPAANYLSGIFSGSGSAVGTNSGGSGYGVNPGSLVSYQNLTNAYGIDELLYNFGAKDTAFAATQSGGLGSLGGAVTGAFGAYGFGQKYGVVGGLAGGVGSVALSGGIGGLMSGAGFFSGAAGALGALGPVGWAALAIGAILGSMGQKGGTPHAGAVAIGSVTGADTPRTQAAIDAYYADPTQNQQFHESDFTKRFSQQTADILAPISVTLAQSLNRITTLYGAGSGYRVGLGFSADGEDKSRGRFSIIDAAGNEVTDFLRKFSKDASKGMEQFGLAAQQGLLQGLRNIDLGSDINAILDKSLKGTTDYLTQLTQEQTAALLGLLDQGVLDDLVKNIDLASASWDDINTRIAQFARIADLKPLFDRVGVSITEFGVDLVNAVGGIDNATAVLNNAINFQQAAAGSANSFAAAIRDIRYGVLDDPGKYEFLDREAQKQRDILASLSDATLIQDYSERLKESIVAAFGLLDPAEQSARSEDFVKKLEEAATLTQERLAVANEAQTKLFDQLPDKVGKAVADGLKPITDAILAAVREGRTIDIRLPAGLEVG